MDSNLVAALITALGRALRRLLRPARAGANLMVGAAGGLTRKRSELMAENALVRQQLIALRRSIARPRLHHDDRVSYSPGPHSPAETSCTWSAPRRCCPGIVWGAERIRDDYLWAA